MQQEIHSHYVLHKPYGYLSQFINNQNKRKNKKLLGELYNFHKNTMAIGRLDEKSEGLLLLTTNGKVSTRITSHKFEKEYYVQVDGVITDNAINKLQKGVTITIHGKPYHTKPCVVFRVHDLSDYPIKQRHVRDERHGPTSWISITLTEGKFRQVRKMTAIVGFPTLRLVRVRIGDIKLDINIGMVREVKQL
ncbi:pseudouridine synthase [Pontimicrobium aquaticum]|uniref:Pseudouridine synthase n=1 Tax=Pontimicrobium aquaticum TaxID=2565367 RepID=A0A4U0EVC8_9FLAO|nr:pseudouridine synthase [Pontimicrobium aquaticum]TJY35815.1 pseudouridine synthase [Pontimicrobium aquaticum]